jgi:hypothetical protein
MAVEHAKGTQLACKIVDLRKLRPSSGTTMGRWEYPAAAEDVDSRVQIVKVRSWGERKKKDTLLQDQLKIYHREANILASISHVSEHSKPQRLIVVLTFSSQTSSVWRRFT